MSLQREQQKGRSLLSGVQVPFLPQEGQQMSLFSIVMVHLKNYNVSAKIADVADIAWAAR